MPEHIMLRNTQSPGDFIVMTAAIRDLSLAHPGRFAFSVDVPQPAVFQSNPHIQGFKSGGGKYLKSVVAQYPAIHQSNQRKGIHFLWGFIEDLNMKLKANAVLTDFRPALYLNEEEKATVPLGLEKPYWVFVSGGKKDYTAKWWDPTCWQQVVDRMVDKGMKMVQVGGGSHIHPRQNNVVDLYGKTSFRELMQLIYHADGVMCIVTCLMHIAAAFNKPCVALGGGREPWWWEAYNEDNRLTNMRKGQPRWTPPENDSFIPHRFLHTVGQLDCCKDFGCWKSKIEKVGKSHCTMPAQQNNVTIPRCMQLITPDMVIESAEWYYKNGLIQSANKLMLTMPKAPPWVVAQLSTVEEVAALIETAESDWIAWADGAPPENENWIKPAISRLNKHSALIGGRLCWLRDQGKKRWYLSSGVALLNRKRLKEAGVVGSTFVNWLADLKSRPDLKVINIGDLVL